MATFGHLFSFAGPETTYNDCDGISVGRIFTKLLKKQRDQSHFKKFVRFVHLNSFLTITILKSVSLIFSLITVLLTD